MNRLLLIALAWAFALPVFSKTLFFQNDTVPPVMLCPPNDTVVVAPGTCTALYLHTVTATDDQPGVTLTQTSGLPSGSDFPLGVTVNNFVATDTAGNTAACSFFIRVFRSYYQLECEEFVELHLDPLDCSATIEPEILVEAIYLQCPSVFSLYISGPGGPPHPNAFDQSDIETTFFVVITDTMTISLPSCVTNVQILEALPAITCTDIDVPCVVPYDQRSPAFLRDSLGFANGFPTVPNGCGDSITLTYLETFLPGSCTTSVYQTIRRTWRATDEEGVTSTCVQNINALNVTLPEIQTPEDVVLDLDCATTWDSTFWFSLPFVPFQNINFTIDAPGCNLGVYFTDTVVVTCPGSREVLRRFSAIDWCVGDFSQDTQRIALPDPVGPAFSCDSVMVVQTDAPDCTVELTWPTFVLNERCSYATGFSASWINGTDTIVQDAVLQNGVDTVALLAVTTDFPAGHTIVTFEAIDACGVVSSCQTQVQVWDNVAPTVVCDSIAHVYLPFEQTLSVLAPEFVVTSDDNCAQLFFKIRRNVASSCDTSGVWTNELLFCCAEVNDTVDVSVRVYDVPPPAGIANDLFGAGQSVTCSLKVVVLDTVYLHCVAPSDTVVSCFELQTDLSLYGAVNFPCSVDSMTQTFDFQDFDTLCQKGVIHREFHVFNTGGQSSTCKQNITVVGPNRNFAVDFPNDIITFNCSFAENPMLSGTPIVLDNACSMLTITYQDVVFTVVPDACLKVERTWTVLDLCLLDSTNQPVVIPNPTPNPNVNHADNLPGPVVAAPGSTAPWTPTVVKINPTAPLPTDYSLFWNDTVAGFTYKQIIKIIDNVDPSIVSCPSTPTLYRDSTGNDLFYWNDPLLEALPIQGNRPEMPVDLSVTGFETCTYQEITIRSWLYLDLDNNGSQETVVYSPQVQMPGKVRYNNANTPGFIGGTLLEFDKRPVPDSLKYRFVLQVEVLDSLTHTTQAHWLWQSGTTLEVPELPHGNHRIKWEVEDGCGNEKLCDYQFTVTDGLPPVLECKDTVSVLMQPNGITTLQATEAWLTPPSDNITPDNLILLSISKNTSPVFPLDPSGDPVEGVNYNCFDPNFQTAQLWAQDGNGNASSCTFVVEILDTAQFCNLNPIVLGGRLYTYGNRNITNTIVAAEAGFPLGNFNAVSNTEGRYEAYYASSGVIFTLTPQRYHDPANGVSTFDLVLINSHILNIQPFDTPYKTIAADANNSKTVTTADIGVLRRLILGISDTLPGQRAWVFVDSAYVFPNPGNPFNPPFPQTKHLINPSGSQLWHHFVGIKIGDLNDNVYVDSLLQQPVEDRKPLHFNLEDLYVEKGETINLYLAPQTSVTAYQFTLDFPGFTCLGIRPDAGLSAENAAIFSEKNKLTVSNDVGGKTGFNLQLSALEGGFLSEKINITSGITPAEAWTSTGERLLPQLVFSKNKPTTSLAAQPSVFTDQTVLVYFLPSETNAEVIVYNAAGQLLLQQTVPGTAGEHQFELHAAMLNNAVGQLILQLKTTTETQTVKLVRQ